LDGEGSLDLVLLVVAFRLASKQHTYNKQKITYHMKQSFFTVFLTLIVGIAFSQITTTKVALKVDQVDSTPYDSLQNFLAKDVYKYLGQELYLKGKSESLRKYGYDGFSKDYTQDRILNPSNVYKCCDSYYSKYDALNSKYFKVIEIIKHPKASENESLYGTRSFLKLQEKESGDIVYFEYDSRFEHTFPFIVVGFFDKQKTLVVGQEFVFGDKVLKSSTDIQTGKVVSNILGQKWKCTDLTIEEQYYTLSLVIENPAHEKTTISYESVFGKWRKGRAYTSMETEYYKKKFGIADFETILQGKVTIGMSKEMCQLSWGEPDKINETITPGKKSEQWIYKDNYLYFDNAILTAIQ
jgi:hypothetical protein